jgi:hypothetical protein
VSGERRGPEAGDERGAGVGSDAVGDDALGRLEERLDRASEAAERLLADITQRVTRKPPPAGWQQPAPAGDDSQTAPALGFGADADLLLGLLGTLRGRIPPELQQRLAEAVREVLLALRALINWYLERTERRRAEPTEIQDIPIL